MTRTQLVVSASAALALCVMMAAHPAAQSSSGPATSTAKWVTPRTAWGDPDLQGVWPSSEMIGVPLQRDPALGTRAFLTDAEFVQREQLSSRQASADSEEFVAARTGGGDGTGPPGHWGERGRPQRQASLIVDPPNGRMPPMTPDGERRAADRARRSSTGPGPFNAPDDLDYYDRCISRGVLGSIAPVVYNNGTEIVQSPGYVAIRYEMIPLGLGRINNQKSANHQQIRDQRSTINDDLPTPWSSRDRPVDFRCWLTYAGHTARAHVVGRNRLD